VAQLNNQDPMNPMDNAQMTSQMAQINTVTGIQQLNQTMAPCPASSRHAGAAGHFHDRPHGADRGQHPGVAEEGTHTAAFDLENQAASVRDPSPRPASWWTPSIWVAGCRPQLLHLGRQQIQRRQVAAALQRGPTNEAPPWSTPLAASNVVATVSNGKLCWSWAAVHNGRQRQVRRQGRLLIEEHTSWVFNKVSPA
jgi:hypothetical protein